MGGLGRETHCFYANHSGIIREALTKVKEDLCTREEEGKQRTGSESLFNWLTTLVTV